MTHHIYSGVIKIISDDAPSSVTTKNSVDDTPSGGIIDMIQAMTLCKSCCTFARDDSLLYIPIA